MYFSHRALVDMDVKLAARLLDSMTTANITDVMKNLQTNHDGSVGALLKGMCSTAKLSDLLVEGGEASGKLLQQMDPKKACEVLITMQVSILACPCH